MITHERVEFEGFNHLMIHLHFSEKFSYSVSREHICDKLIKNDQETKNWIHYIRLEILWTKLKYMYLFLHTDIIGYIIAGKKSSFH
jgi:hypothetical protein